MAVEVYEDPGDDSALIELLATELVQSKTRNVVSQSDKAKKQAALEKQYSARERARKELKAVYDDEIKRLQALQDKGLIDRSTVERVKKQALRQDVELRDSLIMAMASSDTTPNIKPELPMAKFRDPHGHDFVATKPRKLPAQAAHPSQAGVN